MNVGPSCPDPSEGLLTTVGWDLGAHGGKGRIAYALEGAVFVTGAAVQWLRDGLGLITESADIGPLAASVADAEGLVYRPGVHGTGQSVVGSLCPGHHHGHHPRRGCGAPGPGDRRLDRLPGA